MTGHPRRCRQRRLRTRALAALLTALAALPTVAGCANGGPAARGSTAPRQVRQIIDIADTPALPKNFRVAGAVAKPEPGSKAPSLEGLATLHASGSGVFSTAGLRTVNDHLPAGHGPVVDVDLRQESHLYVNGMPVSWFGDKDDANIGLSHGRVLADEQRRQEQLERTGPVSFDWIPGKSVKPDGPVRDPKTVRTEADVVEQAGWRYVRLTVPDHHRPQNDEVDRFVAFVRSLPQGTWLHFHCRAGVGRTTTFMAMYDMMRNARRVSLDDILRRQALIGGKDLTSEAHSDKPEARERAAFLRAFYAYAQKDTDGFKTPYSRWAAGR
ncbi:phosphatase domain-containing putative toxin [Streptomyces sp. GS7]|uniref:phosphatase domain-containing putative toxin n=1 Tax=Streptomyces sp. GS7 TaxID=2692234 RepID=UPI0013164520|nr:protein tyrosine phosphatase [Streptomyces sp. GS7]QHC23634.1 protein tyrosine phosphatase [Streptomyces sp. GS7]